MAKNSTTPPGTKQDSGNLYNFSEHVSTIMGAMEKAPSDVIVQNIKQNASLIDPVLKSMADKGIYSKGGMGYGSFGPAQEIMDKVRGYGPASQEAAAGYFAYSSLARNRGIDPGINIDSEYLARGGYNISRYSGSFGAAYTQSAMHMIRSAGPIGAFGDGVGSDSLKDFKAAMGDLTKIMRDLAKASQENLSVEEKEKLVKQYDSQREIVDRARGLASETINNRAAWGQVGMQAIGAVGQTWGGVSDFFQSREIARGGAASFINNLYNTGYKSLTSGDYMGMMYYNALNSREATKFAEDQATNYRWSRGLGSIANVGSDIVGTVAKGAAIGLALSPFTGGTSIAAGALIGGATSIVNKIIRGAGEQSFGAVDYTLTSREARAKTIFERDRIQNEATNDMWSTVYPSLTSGGTGAFREMLGNQLLGESRTARRRTFTDNGIFGFGKRTYDLEGYEATGSRPTGHWGRLIYGADPSPGLGLGYQERWRNAAMFGRFSSRYTTSVEDNSSPEIAEINYSKSWTKFIGDSLTGARSMSISAGEYVKLSENMFSATKGNPFYSTNAILNTAKEGLSIQYLSSMSGQLSGASLYRTGIDVNNAAIGLLRDTSGGNLAGGNMLAAMGAIQRQDERLLNRGMSLGKVMLSANLSASGVSPAAQMNAMNLSSADIRKLDIAAAGKNWESVSTEYGLAGISKESWKSDVRKNVMQSLYYTEWMLLGADQKVMDVMAGEGSFSNLDKEQKSIFRAITGGGEETARLKRVGGGASTRPVGDRRTEWEKRFDEASMESTRERAALSKTPEDAAKDISVVVSPKKAKAAAESVSEGTFNITGAAYIYLDGGYETR